MKDFEDTDREGTTMDRRKPLTVGEIEELKELLEWVNLTVGTQMSRSGRSLLLLTGYTDRLLSLLTPPPDEAVREAVERLDAYTGAPGPHLEYTASGGAGRDIRTLLRAVQAPRLTPEQVEAVKMAETLLTDTMSDYGDCEHDVGHCICKYHSGVFSLRSAFPDLFTGEVGNGM